jgi:hypothetical protein
MRKLLWMAGLSAGLFPGSLDAQGSGLSGACSDVVANLQSTCRVVAQAVESGQPQLGILVAGGNPTIGTASTGGLRLGVLPRVSATVKATFVRAMIPDLRESRIGPTDGVEFGDLSIIAPSFSATATIGIFGGASVAPTIGGIGSVDLLGSASWVPLRSIGSDDFRPNSADIAYGGGLRIGLLRESFTMPGASVSLMYHKLGSVSYGEICPTRVATSTADGNGYTLEQGQCAPTDAGNLGEFRFDLSSWSTRAAVSKHLLGLGISAGVGYDRFSSDLAAGLRAPQSGISTDFSYARVTGVDLSQGRWSAFVDGSFSLLVATIAVEAGWLQGADPVPGYPDNSSDFDPGDGTYFGSVGLRIAL